MPRALLSWLLPHAGVELTPALGLGGLRLLRVRVRDGAHDGAFELAVGYDGYERL